MISLGDISNIKFYSIALLCGGLVLSPIIYYLLLEYPLIGNNIFCNETLVTFVIFLASLIIGLLILDVATWLEGDIDEKLNNTLKEDDYSDSNDEKPHYREWYRYLLVSNNNELIIHKVISYIVFRVKFELALFISLIVFYIEFLTLIAIKTISIFNSFNSFTTSE
jgi:hypothetical protein